jgi:HNH endonuclease
MKDRTPPSLMGGGNARVIQVCVTCGDDYRIPAKLAQRYTTCSRECSTERRSALGYGYTWVECAECRTEMQVRVARVESGFHRYCSDGCRMKGLNKIPRKRGSTLRYITPKGYVRVIDWSTGRRRYIMEHRLVMEGVIGRSLTRGERVHHINGDRTDNRPENLRLYPSHAEHIRIEHPEQAAIASNIRWSRHKARQVA